MYFLFLFGKIKEKKKREKYFKGKKQIQQNKSDMFQCYNVLHLLNFISKNSDLKNTKRQNVVPMPKQQIFSRVFHPM